MQHQSFDHILSVITEGVLYARKQGLDGEFAPDAYVAGDRRLARNFRALSGLKEVRRIGQRRKAMGNFEVGTEQRLFRNARQRSGDLLLLLGGGRAHVQNINFDLRLG